MGLTSTRTAAHTGQVRCFARSAWMAPRRWLQSSGWRPKWRIAMSSNRAGSCVQNCGESNTAPEYMAPPPEADATHRVEFHFATQTGHAIYDDAGFTLIHPDGHEEQGVLSNGGLERAGVPEGLYRMKFSTIESCGWSQISVYGEQELEMWVNHRRFDGRPRRAFPGYPPFPSRAPPVGGPRTEIQG